MRRHTQPPPEMIVEGSLKYIGVQPYRPSPRAWLRRRKRRQITRLLPALLLTLIGLAFYGVCSAKAIVSITPVAMEKEEQVILSIPARPLVETQQSTIAASASGAQQLPATHAHGVLTWQNATPRQQVIPAQTQISVVGNLQIETDIPVIVPAAQLPTPGQATGVAHIVQTGAHGNIAAGLLSSSPCQCASPGVVVTNGSFTGGQDASTVAVVQSQDITHAVATQKVPLVQQTAALLQAHLTPGEALAPPVCTTQITPDHPAGSTLPIHISSLHILLTSTCTSRGYSQKDVQQRAIQFFQQTRPDTSYQLDQPEVHVVGVNGKDTMLSVAVQIHGRWIYHFSPQFQRTLAQRLAGTSQTQAAELLTHMQGIAQIHITCFWFWLPSDPTRIMLIEEPTHSTGTPHT